MPVIPLLVLSLTAAVEEPLTIRSGDDPRIVEVSFQVVPEQVAAANGKLEFEAATRHLKLVVVNEGGEHGPPVFGTYRLVKSRLVFEPRYPLLRGVKYTVIGTPNQGKLITKSFVVSSESNSQPPRVVAFFPSGKVLPANCLKFYIHFSKPMREGRAIFEQIQIIGPDGKEVVAPWRRTELWNEDATRLTMWIHPGRIKQGVNLREKFGPVLKPESKYRIVVGKDVRDATGVHLAEPFEATFLTAGEDRSRPIPARWKLSSPKAGTREPLRVIFDEPLDRALLNRMLAVKSGEVTIAGSIQVRPGETLWQFTPKENWLERKYVLHIDGRLEDLAGNTPLRVFDTDLSDGPAAQPELALPVRIQPVESR